jgi:protease-4
MKKWSVRLFKIVFIIFIIAFFVQAMLLFFNDEVSVIKSDKIVVVNLDGIILESEPIIQKLKKYEKNPNVKGIIIKINSPGGGVAPSQEIYRHIRKMKIPVYAAMSSLAASGGYYVAAACDKIYALPGTITGSIGVIMKFSNMEGLYSKIGIKSETIKSGKFKDIGSPDRKMTDAEKKLLKSAIMDVYNQFISDILKGRSMKKSLLLKYADGRILTGSQAKKLGFVDAIGTYDEAFIDMKKELKNPNVTLYEPDKKTSLLEELIGETKSFTKKFKSYNGFYYLFEM